MPIISRFAGFIDANSYAYGISGAAPVGLQVINGSTVSGAATLTCQSANTAGGDGVIIKPSTNTPILVGFGSNSETVTPTAVSYDNFGNILITATFANAHGTGDLVRSGTCGLQEALNYAGSIGGGEVVVSPQWALFGGTNAFITAAVVPATVQILDNRTGGGLTAGNIPGSVTALAAPTALTTAVSANGQITGNTTGGTIPASSAYRLGVTYVDAFGGETTLSIDTASTAVVTSSSGSTNSITVTSPAALTGAIGYRVYMSAASGASLSEILYPVGNAAITGTAVTGGPIVPCFQIGTPVTITAIITGTAKIPAQNSAYAPASALLAGPAVVSYPPFTALGTIAAAATGTVGEFNFPAGFFNSLGRTVRIKGMLYATTNGTGGTITLQHILASIYGVTSITPFSAVTASVAASAIAVSMIFEVTYVTAAVGATGTLECHGFALYNIAGTAVATGTMDNVITVSSAVDLTKQLTLSVAHLNTTLGTTVSQLRQLTLEVLQ